MMDEREALHTSVRRWVMEQVPELSVSWLEEILPLFRGGVLGRSFPERTSPFSRAVFDQFLMAVETLVPSRFASREELLAALLDAAAHSGDLGDDASPLRVQEIQATQERITSYLKNLSSVPSDEIPRLPYRRVLQSDESDCIWRKLEETWGVDGREYWVPADDLASDRPLMTFHGWWFDKHFPPPLLRRIWAAHGVRRIWQLSEYAMPPQYEMDLELFIPWCTWETYWTSETMDWLMYRSHEDNVTIGGRWLLDALKEVVGSWEEGLVGE